MERQLKQLQIQNDEGKKRAHLQAVEEVLEGRSIRRKFDWAMPLTVLFTAVVLCFLVLAPGLQQDLDGVGQSSEASLPFEKGYAYIGELGKMPSTMLVYGVKKLNEQQLIGIEERIQAGKSMQPPIYVAEPSYELGLMRGDEEQYIRVYYENGGPVFHFVEEDRWLEIDNKGFYELMNAREHKWMKTIVMALFGLLTFGYMIYVEKKYMKDEEGRKRKQYAELWHGALLVMTFGFGLFYVLFAPGAIIPIAYVVSVLGLAIVAYLDRKNPEFAYRKYFYSAQLIHVLFFLTMFSFVNTF